MSSRKALKFASNGAVSEVRFPQETEKIKRFMKSTFDSKSIRVYENDDETISVHVVMYFTDHPWDDINKCYPCLHGDIFLSVDVEIFKGEDNEMSLKDDYDVFFDQYNLVKMLRDYVAFESLNRKFVLDFSKSGYNDIHEFSLANEETFNYLNEKYKSFKYVDENALFAKVARKLCPEDRGPQGSSVPVRWGANFPKTPYRSVLEYSTNELHLARHALSEKLATTTDSADRATIRAKVSAYKKYILSLDKPDMVRRWDTLLNLCNEVGDMKGAVIAERRRNKARQCQLVETRELSPGALKETPSEQDTPAQDCEPPSTSMSSAARKHRAALKKHGLGSRQEQRARRDMVEFDRVLMM